MPNPRAAIRRAARLGHLPDLPPMTRAAGEDRWHTLRAAFGPPALDFFHWQERTADTFLQLFPKFNLAAVSCRLRLGTT